MYDIVHTLPSRLPSSLRWEHGNDIGTILCWLYMYRSLSFLLDILMCDIPATTIDTAMSCDIPVCCENVLGIYIAIAATSS